MKKRTISLVGLPVVAALALSLGACSSGASGSQGGDSKNIRVAYGVSNGVAPLAPVLEKAKAQVEKDNPGAKVELIPIEGAQGDYQTKLSLMNQAADTAPDVIYEDSFLVRADAQAGYLAPLDDYLASWEDWKQFPEAAREAGVGDDGKIYGVSLGTDTQGLWYNKKIFAKAGLPVPFEPKTWQDMLDAARAIKKADPKVNPWVIYAGTQVAEMGSVRGFQSFLTGTDDVLYNGATKKWVLGSQGFLDVLKLIDTNFKEKLGPEAAEVSDPNLGGTVPQDWIPNGKVAMVCDGSWLPQVWTEAGANPWPEWEETIGWAAIPTQNGQEPGSTSMSGGWTLAMGAKSKNPQLAWQFMSHVLSKDGLKQFAIEGTQIAVRDDVASDPDYQKSNPSVPFFTDLVKVTHFRPSTPIYQQVSNEISIAQEGVMTGQKTPEEAQADYDEAVKGIVGEENTEEK